MKTSFVLAGFAALATVTAFTSARADGEERWPRWYIGLTGGYTYMGDEDISNSATGATKLSPNDGFGIGGSIGYLPTSSMPLLNALRFEAEVTYHENDVHSIHLANGTNIAGSGTYDSTAYMANAFYDLPTGSPWSPYIGAGIGMATLHLPTQGGVSNSGGSDNEFAYQGMVGIGYSPQSIPNTQWSLGYRYLGTSDAKFSGADVQYSTSSVELGAKFRF